MNTYKHNRVSASVCSHLLITIVHGRLHMNKNLLYKVVVACVDILWHGMVFLVVIVGISRVTVQARFGIQEAITGFPLLVVGYALVATAVWELCTFGMYALLGLELSWWIATIACNKVYPETSKRYKLQIFHSDSAP